MCTKLNDNHLYTKGIDTKPNNNHNHLYIKGITTNSKQREDYNLVITIDHK